MRTSQQFNAKFALFSLAATFFGVGVTEFISVGVLPAISTDFHVSTSTAGLITSMYALGVAIGAPLLTILTAKVKKKRVILSAITLFIAGHLIIGFAPTFSIVLIGRIVAALAHGILFALSATIAADLVAPEKQAGAIAFVFGGFTIATALGAPLGTYVSDMFGWRIPFLAIAILGVIALFLNIIALPDIQVETSQLPNFHDQIQLTFNKHILLTLLITILGYGGTFATFTYLSPMLQRVTGVQAKNISLILVIYGVAIAIGNTFGGKFGNSQPVKLLLKIFLPQSIALVAFYFTVPHFALSLLNIIVLGLLAFMSVPVLQSYILTLAKRYVPTAVDMASSLNIMSFSAGIALGSYMGGLATRLFGIRSTTLIAGIMVGLAVILTLAVVVFENSNMREFENGISE
jgi:predicted MFS family arabinose efflux permease